MIAEHGSMCSPRLAEVTARLDEALEYIRQLRNSTAADELARSRLRQLKYTANETVVLGSLIKKPNIRRETVRLLMLPHNAGGVVSLASVKLLMFRLRRKLTTHGVTLLTDWGTGWSLDDRGHSALRELACMAAGVQEGPSSGRSSGRR